MVGGDIGKRRGTVDVIAQDIQPIITRAGSLRPRGSGLLGLVLIAALPMAAYAAFAFIMARKRRFAHDQGYARAYHAKSKGQKRLEAVAESDKPAEELYRAVVGYLADSFDVSEAGMTSSDARNLLRGRGIDGELSDSFEGMLRACERARYATAALSKEEIQAMLDAAAQGIEQLEATVKKGRSS